jgi:hypothetical protein
VPTHTERFTETASSGSISNEIDKPFNSILRQILCKPATGSTTYNLSVENSDGLKIYENTSNTGETQFSMTVPVSGKVTVKIASASVDEAFIIHLLFDRIL